MRPWLAFALAFVLALGAARAFADGSTCVVWTAANGPGGRVSCSGGSAEACAEGALGPWPNDPNSPWVRVPMGDGGMSCDLETPSSLSSLSNCVKTYTSTNPVFNETSNVTVSAGNGSCPVECPSAGTPAGSDALGVQGSPYGDGVTACWRGCEYSLLSTLQIGPRKNYNSVFAEATATGNQCTSSEPQAVESSCTAANGSVDCVEAATASPTNTSGKNCGTFNGDEVCIGSIPPGTCVSYESGGVACVAASGSSTVQSPPAPDNGTPGTPATPTGTVTQGNGSSQTSASYYSSTVVAASSAPTQTNPGGQNTGNGGTKGTGAGAGGTNAANGDCGASGVNCAGDGTLPTLGSVNSIATTSSGYATALSSVPIVAAVSAISASVPDGSCPTATFSVLGRSYTLDEQCTLWGSVASVVSACMLALYAILGVKILLSA